MLPLCVTVYCFSPLETGPLITPPLMLKMALWLGQIKWLCDGLKYTLVPWCGHGAWKAR